MFEHVFDTIDFNEKYQNNGILKFEKLLTTFNLVLSEENVLHYEWVNYNHSLVLITEYNPLTGEHAFNNTKKKFGVLGHTEVLCDDKFLLGKFVSQVDQFAKNTSVF